MKKILTILLILIISGSSLFLDSCKNKIKDRETSGTIGQVEKYRKEQMSEKDILLRSEVMKDTSQLNEIIQGLIFFNAYASTLEKSLDNRLVDMQSIKGFNEKYDQFILQLTDFRDFLKNHNTVLNNTVVMLADFYHDTITGSSADVENNLRDFVNYTRQLEQKDSVLTIAINNLDTYIEGKEQSVVDKEEVARLKAIRDELLVRVIQQSLVLDDPAFLLDIGQKKLYNLDNLEPILDQPQLQLVVGNVDLETIWGFPVASIVLQWEPVLNAIASGVPLGGGGGGGSSLPPLGAPAGTYGGTGLPPVLQGLFVADKDFVSSIHLLSSGPQLTDIIPVISAVTSPVAAADDLALWGYVLNTAASAVNFAEFAAGFYVISDKN